MFWNAMRHLPVRGVMNCATTSQLFVNDRRLFRNGINISVILQKLVSVNKVVHS